VVSGTGPRRVLIYLGRNAGPGRPKPEYMESVVAAARAAALPESYLREIGVWLPSGMARYTGPEPTSWRPAVTPTRGSPRDPVVDRNANWIWKP
jgi:hypothetical protein